MDRSRLLERWQAWTTVEALSALLVSLGEIALLVVVALLVHALAARAVDSALLRLEGRTQFFSADRTDTVRRLARSVLRYGVIVLVLVIAAGILGLDVSALLVNPTLRGWIYAALLIVAAHLAIRVGSMLIDEIFERTKTDERVLGAKRAVTLRGLLKSVLRYSVDIATLILVLSNLGFNTTGLLASIGVASLAIGFGAQSLVRDVISGFFILFEDQFRVGDYVETDGVFGSIEEMGFRVTKIRDFGGQLHIIPNGRIERVTNYSTGPMRVMFEVGIAYEEDVDRAIEVMRQTCEAYAAQDARVVEAPRILGVSALADSSVNILVWGKAQSGEQWDVERQLRRAIKKALDQAGIEAPYPRRVWIPAAATRTAQEGGADTPGTGAAAAVPNTGSDRSGQERRETDG